MSLTTKERVESKGSKTDSILTRHRTDEHSLRTRQRRTGLLTVAALLIIGSALAGGLVFARAANTVEVLAIREAVPKGHEITRDNIIARNVSGVPDTIPATSIHATVGKVASVDLVAGQLLTSKLVTNTPVPGPGQALVGLNLDPARVPNSGLSAGDVVNIVAVPAGGSQSDSESQLDAPPFLSRGSTIYDVKGSSTEGGAVLVTVVVNEDDSPRVAAYSTAGRVALVRTSAGDN